MRGRQTVETARNETARKRAERELASARDELTAAEAALAATAGWDRIDPAEEAAFINRTGAWSVSAGVQEGARR